MKQRTKSQSPIVAIEICRTRLEAIVLRPQAAEKHFVVQSRSILWRHDAPSLATESGAKELSAAFKQLVHDQRLTGAKAYLCLNGDYCVTRVVTGTTAEVRREVAQLEERSSLYLSLGVGPKALAASIRQIDARHQHALLTVTNKRVLNTVVEVATQAGLEIDQIEPSLVALSRLVGKTGSDAEAPAMIIGLNEGSVELGISHQGQLLLDYRPGGRSTTGDVADITTRHLARLQRYCRRYLRFSESRLNRVFLCGPPEAVAAAKAGFASHENLIIEVLDPAQIDAQWEFADEVGIQTVAALGTALLAHTPENQRTAPNLMERLRAETRERLLPALWRVAWPAAAAFLIGAVLFGFVTYERLGRDALQAELQSLEPTAARFAQLRGDMLKAEETIRHLKHIKGKISNPVWNQVLAMIGHCMPEDVWLETLASSSTGRLSLSGASYGQDGVYEFVRLLQKAPGLAQVALEQTQPTTVANGPATRFDLGAEFTDRAGSPAGGK